MKNLFYREHSRRKEGNIGTGVSKCGLCLVLGGERMKSGWFDIRLFERDSG